MTNFENLRARFSVAVLIIIALVQNFQVCDAWSGSGSPKSIEKTMMVVVNNNNNKMVGNDNFVISRRDLIGHTVLPVVPTLSAAVFLNPKATFADDTTSATTDVSPPTAVPMSSDARKLFNEGRAYEAQGNIAAAQRVYSKVTKIEPRFIYGWSNLGNTQVALGALGLAEESYNTAIDLCSENLSSVEKTFGGVRRCDEYSTLLLNRGCLQLNTGRGKEALEDLQKASVLRGRPDAVIAQNLARAEEKNGLFTQADREYNLAISMTSNEVNPYWLRSAMVKFQLGNVQGGFDLVKRVENRFPEAPEVKAAYAVFLAARGDPTAAQQKYLEIPDRQREKYVQIDYLTNVISWPPAMIDGLAAITMSAGDGKPL